MGTALPTSAATKVVRPSGQSRTEPIYLVSGYIPCTDMLSRSTLPKWNIGDGDDGPLGASGMRREGQSRPYVERNSRKNFIPVKRKSHDNFTSR